MNGFEEWCSRACRGIFLPGDREDVRQELMWHLEDRCEELLKKGMPPEEAAKAAILAMGDADTAGRLLCRAHSPLRGGIVMLKKFIQNHRWVKLYSGKDEKRFEELCGKLNEAGIRFRANRLQPEHRAAAVLSMPQNYNRNRGPYIQTENIGAKLVAESASMNQYVIEVRGRDLLKASRV